jgi:murein DD-endopeptidase MepM/ murein hydrolase activator NlpD
VTQPWLNPIQVYQLVPTSDSMSFLTMPKWHTGLPLPPHPGAFGVKRKNHTHEGVDLYCPQCTPVTAVEDGEVVAVVPFTGPHCNMPWWLDTWAVLVEGPTGVVLYGEIAPHIKVGKQVKAGELIGIVLRVLRTDKGRPTSMLHLELRTPGSREWDGWYDVKPASLLDPTPYLLDAQAIKMD